MKSEKQSGKDLEFQELKRRVSAERATGATKRAKDNLEDSYRFKIAVVLKHPEITGKERERLMEWYDKGITRNLPLKPKILHWLPEQIWTSFVQTTRASIVFALGVADKEPAALNNLSEEFRQLIRPFMGRPRVPDYMRMAIEALGWREAGFKGIALARKVCREAKKDSSHQCDNNCSAAVRVAIRDYKKSRKPTAAQLEGNTVKP
jgi:hypothetical protein